MRVLSIQWPNSPYPSVNNWLRFCARLKLANQSPNVAKRSVFDFVAATRSQYSGVRKYIASAMSRM